MKRIVKLIIPFCLLSVCFGQIHTATNSKQMLSLQQSSTQSGNQLPLAEYKRMSRLALEMWASNNSVDPEKIFTKNYRSYALTNQNNFFWKYEKKLYLIKY